MTGFKSPLAPLFQRLFCRMIVMLSSSDCHFQERRGVRAETWRRVERPEPAEVVVEVAARHALEAAHPITQPRAEGIDVLDVPSAVDPDAGGEVDGVVLDTQRTRRDCQGTAPIRAQHRIAWQDWLEHGAGCLSCPRLEDEIGRAARAVTSDQHRQKPFSGGTALAGLAAAVSRLAQQTALSFSRFQEIGLIGLGDAHQYLSLNGLRE